MGIKEVEDFSVYLQEGNPVERLAQLYGLERKEGETDDELVERVKKRKGNRDECKKT